MAVSESSNPRPSLRATKIAVVFACVFWLPTAALTAGLATSLGEPWPLFFCTWGVVLVAAFVGFVGYFSCRSRGVRISVFYAICPTLLFISFFVFLNLPYVVHAFFP